MLAIYFLIFNNFTQVDGQQYIPHILHFGVKDGLSHRETYCIHTDAQGFLWIGTKNGINRFDGYQFKWFTKEKDGLASNEIHQILEDGEGWLWLFTYTPSYYTHDAIHLTLLNTLTGEVKSPEERFGSNLPIDFSKINRAISKDNGTIWIGTKDGNLFKYIPGIGFEISPFKSKFPISPLIQTSNNNVWISAVDKKSDDAFFKVNSNGIILDEINGEWLIAMQGGEYGYWMEDSDMAPIILYQFTITGAINKIDLSGVPIKKGWYRNDWRSAIYYNPANEIFWYKDQDKLFAFHPEKGILFDFEKDHPELIKSEIWNITFDLNGIAWITTANGIYRVALRKNSFQKYLSDVSNNHQIDHFKSCRGIIEIDNNLRVNTQDSGVYNIQLSTSKVSRLPVIQLLSEGKIHYYESFIPIISIDNNKLLTGAIHLVEHDLVERSYKNIYVEGNTSPVFWALFQDSRKKIWAGLNGGLLGWLEPGCDSVYYYNNWNGFEPDKSVILYDFLEIDEQNILLATSSGVYNMNHADGITNRYWTGGIGDDHLPFDIIYDFYQDNEKTIWMATGGGGLIKWQLHSLGNIDWKQYTIADGLASNVLYAVYGDDQKNLWLPSDYGLIRYNKNTGYSTSYLERDGISHHEFNRASHYQSEDGTLYFGGLNGVTAFLPDEIAQHDTLNAPFRITEFLQFDSKRDSLIDRTKELISLNEIMQQPGDNFFTLQFSLLNYEDTEYNSYAYKIEGQDKTWSQIKTNRLRISGLPYGEFRLRIKAQAGNGQFSRNELDIPIFVIKPFYLHSWFLILNIMGVLGLILFIYKYRTGQLKKRQLQLESLVKDRTLVIGQQTEELRSLDKAKSRFFANVSHELRTPLTLMKGPINSMLKSDQLNSKNKAFATLASKSTDRLLLLVKEIMDLSKIDAGQLKLHEESTTLYPLIQRLLASFESHAHLEGILLELEYKPEFDLQLLLDYRKLEKVINNLLFNAFKHTNRGGEIRIVIKDLGDFIQMQIMDTGNGIDSEDLPFIFDRYFQSKKNNAPVQGGTGIGLSLCNEYIKLMEGSIWAISELNKGSQFYFKIPKKEVMDVAEIILGPEAEIVKREIEIQTKSSDGLPYILVVEDNKSLRDYIQIILQERFNIQLASNGQEALDILEDSEFDFQLMISDIMMPVMDGYQLLEKVKSNDKFRQLPVIMLTARSAQEDKLKALRLGIDDYMLKPFDEDELIVRIQNLLHNKLNRSRWQNDINFTELEENETMGIEITPIDSIELTKMPKAQLSKFDEEWLEQLETMLAKKHKHFNFNVEFLASEMYISRQHLTRRVKLLTGLTATQYLQEFRLNQARILLELEEGTSIKAIALEVGFRNIKYFSRQFKKRFGKNPSSYLA